MNNQVLSIEQMQELKELGIDVSNASMYYVIDDGEILDLAVLSCSIEHIRDINKNNGLTYIPTFTLQDILEMLPHTIKQKPYKYNLTLDNSDKGWCIYYTEGMEALGGKFITSDTILEAAFNMLKWCKQNNYI